MTERYRIEWVPVAQADLDEIMDYIAAHDTVEAAIHVYSKIITKIDGLASHPARCRIVPELKKLGVCEYRELIISPYSVFFRITGHTVGIIGVLDRRRDLEEILIQRVLRI